MLKVGDWVLERDGSISQIVEIESSLWFPDAYKLLNPAYEPDSPYWIMYQPIKLTELLEALL